MITHLEIKGKPLLLWLINERCHSYELMCAIWSYFCIVILSALTEVNYLVETPSVPCLFGGPTVTAGSDSHCV